ADDHVLVGEELVEGTDGETRPVGDLLAGERLEADLEQDVPRDLQQVVELDLAAGLRGTPARFEDLGRHGRKTTLDYSDVAFKPCWTRGAVIEPMPSKPSPYV